MTFNPVELEIFKQLFASAAEEMGVRLMRSAYSPNIKERRDFSCALFDHRSDMFAQAAHIPVHLGSAPASVKAVLQAFSPGEMRPGDRFIVNDPYAGGTHLPDVTVVAPCFCAGAAGGEAPRFFVANRAHHADVGGASPGSMPLTDTIEDEGFRLPPSRVTPDLTERFCAASRTPDERRGDVRAQLAGVDLGVERLRGLVDQHGGATVAAAAEAVQAYAARFVGDLIRGLPDGTYHAQDVLDDDGLGHADLAIRCTLTVDGDRATVDLRQSDDQAAGPLNAVRSICLSAALYCFRGLAGGEVPGNSGVLRPVTVLTRPGSLVDARYPAPVAGGNVETSQRITDVILRALAQAAPDRVPAASCGSMNNVLIGSARSAECEGNSAGRQSAEGTGDSAPDPAHCSLFPPHFRFAYYETIAGGAGGGPLGPGGDAIHTHMTNTLNTPVEALEHAYPFRIEAYRVRAGSGGDGRHRGGDGVTRVYRFDRPARVTLLTERRVHPPYGLADGEPGAVGVNRLIPADGPPRDLPGKCEIDVQPGDQLELHTPGGGGWGARPPT